MKRTMLFALAIFLISFSMFATAATVTSISPAPYAVIKGSYNIAIDYTGTISSKSLSSNFAGDTFATIADLNSSLPYQLIFNFTPSSKKGNRTFTFDGSQLIDPATSQPFKITINSYLDEFLSSLNGLTITINNHDSSASVQSFNLEGKSIAIRNIDFKGQFNFTYHNFNITDFLKGINFDLTFRKNNLKCDAGGLSFNNGTVANGFFIDRSTQKDMAGRMVDAFLTWFKENPSYNPIYDLAISEINANPLSKLTPILKDRNACGPYSWNSTITKNGNYYYASLSEGYQDLDTKTVGKFKDLINKKINSVTPSELLNEIIPYLNVTTFLNFSRFNSTAVKLVNKQTGFLINLPDVNASSDLSAVNITTGNYTITINFEDPYGNKVTKSFDLVLNIGTFLTELNTAIATAQGTHNIAVEGNATGDYPTGSKATLQAAIDAATAIRDNPASSQSQIDGAVTTLNNAVAAFQVGIYKVIFNNVHSILTGAGIVNNIETCGTAPTACSGLSFEKTGFGKIAFSNALNLTDNATTTFLQSLETKLNFTTAKIGFDASTAEAFKEAGAVLTMYDLGFQGTPEIIVELDNGTIVSSSDSRAGVSALSYSGGTLTFNAAHFTDFNAVDKSALKAVITKAESTYASSPTGIVAGTWLAADKTAFQSAIDAAKVVRDNGAASQASVNSAKDTLETAMGTFSTKKILKVEEISIGSASENATFNATKTVMILNNTEDTGNLSEVTVPNTVSDSTEVKLDLGSAVKLTNDSKAQVTVSVELTLTRESATSANNFQITIPAGVKIKDTDGTWNGSLVMPIVKATSSVTLPTSSGFTKSVNKVMEVGLSDKKLVFDKGVRILLPGQAGLRAGYSRPSQAFTEITATCSADSQATGNALAAEGDCKINSGSDLVIWTKHFTSFSSYTQTAVTTTTVSSGGGGGGGQVDCSNTYSCSEWSTCTAGTQARTCTKLKYYCTSIAKPAETQSCVAPTTIVTTTTTKPEIKTINLGEPKKPETTIGFDASKFKPAEKAATPTGFTVANILGLKGGWNWGYLVALAALIAVAALGFQKWKKR
jgi:hypothetical protein